eukprot:182171-Pyramimonas_sp.AAC.1
MGSSIHKTSGSILAGADWEVEAQVVKESGFTRKAGLIVVIKARASCPNRPRPSTTSCARTTWFGWSI